MKFFSSGSWEAELNAERQARKAAELALVALRSELDAKIALLNELNRELEVKNEDVETFVYSISHDLRAPLVNLKGFARELELGCADLEKFFQGIENVDSARKQAFEQTLAEGVRTPLRFIGAGSDKLQRLIDLLLKLSRTRRQQYAFAPVAITPLVVNVVAAVNSNGAERRAQIEVGALPDAFGDPTAVEQIFSNLISNAVNYLDPQRPGKIEVAGEQNLEVCHYWVRDNGIGLSEHSKDRLFKVFQRFSPEKAPGEGIGLAIIKRIVEKHGGKIWAESQAGVGSTFHFTLPMGHPTPETHRV